MAISLLWLAGYPEPNLEIDKRLNTAIDDLFWLAGAEGRPVRQPRRPRTLLFGLSAHVWGPLDGSPVPILPHPECSTRLTVGRSEGEL